MAATRREKTVTDLNTSSINERMAEDAKARSLDASRRAEERYAKAKLAAVKIIGDGTRMGTTVTVNGHVLACRRVVFDLDEKNRMALVTLEVPFALVEIEGEMAVVEAHISESDEEDKPG